MSDFKVNSLDDLYRKLMPALSTKVADLKRHNIKHISENDIWLYLRGYYWQRGQELTLGEIVNDILATPNRDLEAYMVKKDDNIVQEKESDGLL